MYDLETLVLARYTGEARLQRLLFVAAHGQESSVVEASYEAAVEQALHQGNVQRYKEIFHIYTQQQQQQDQNGEGGGLLKHAFDTVWLQEKEALHRRSREQLSSRLSSAKAHLNKDAIRTAYLALAEHDVNSGDLADAFHAVLRAKDYCTSRNQTAAVSLQILEVSLHLKNYATVRDYVTKIEHTLGSSSSGANASAGGSNGLSDSSGMSMSAVRNKVFAAAGLERLAAADYVTAAHSFRRVACAGMLGSGASSGSAGRSEGSNGLYHWETVLAADDLALYAAFLSLAVIDCRETLVALAEHPEALELVPQAREALLQFARRANYQQTWKLLEEHVFPILELDLFMSSHLPTLKEKIREKSIQNYWKAYQRVELSVMAEQLGPGLVKEGNLLDTLVELIGMGGLPADTRIDMQSQTLVRQEPQSAEEERLATTSNKLTRLTSKVLDDTYSMVIRLSCLEHDLVVADPSGRSRRGQRGYYDVGGPGGGNFGGGEMVESDDEEMDAPSLDRTDGMNPEDMY